MKMLIVTHAPFEKAGSIETWAKKNAHDIQEVRPYMGEKLPDINEFDFLVVMGGFQSPLKMEAFPYLADEIGFIKKAIFKQKRIVGICLGAQLIGEALGAKTEPSPNREIGMFLMEQLEEAKFDPVFGEFPVKYEAMHWHSDMPGIPVGASLLAKSEGCPRQIFRYGDRVYGFQCHLELTRELVQDMIKHCPDDLRPGPYVRSMEELINADFSQINAKMDRVLDYLADLPELVLKRE